MRYLKIFEDFDNSFLNKLKEFCQDHLAYLIDEGIGVNVTYNRHSGDYEVIIGTKETIDQYSGFIKWSDIRDSVLPFLHFLQKDYKIALKGRLPFSVFIYNKKTNEVYWEGYTYQEMEMDKIDDIKNITICIRE